MDKKSRKAKYLQLISVIFLMISGAVWFIYSSQIMRPPEIGQKKIQASSEELDSFKSFHQSLVEEEKLLREKYEVTNGVRTEEWKKFGLVFSKRVRGLSKNFTEILQFEGKDKPLKNKLIEALTRQNQMLIFLWREMNQELLKGESRVPLAEKELALSKAVVSKLVIE